jgi:D-serine deaminase-like pyridoxal phosphate-dependent protein
MTTDASSTPTPSLVIDLPTVKRNIAKLAAYGREHNLGIRPHTKTHKSIRMAKLQLEAGAVGLTVAKAGEAMTMAQAGKDIFVAYPALDPWRREHLANLARTHAVRVGIDSTEAADAIGEAARAAEATIGVLVDLDVGFHRTGMQTPAAALELAQHISRTRGLRLDGIMCFPGQIKQPPDEQRELFKPIATLLGETISLWTQHGLEARVVSGGSSPTAYFSHWIPQLTEIRPGTYIYNDMNMVSCGFAALEDCAARFTCTVVSNAVPGKFVIDAGTKTLASDRRACDGETAGFGHIVEYPAAKIVRLSEEHGEVDVSQCDARAPRLGERVHVIPNHICPCVNLHTMAWVRDASGKLEPMQIDARGQVW